MDSGVLRVFRGGSWNNILSRLRVAFRHNNSPSNRGNNVGLRLVLVAPSL
ncbi:MAG: SUMF1/EgtB/PvdO family nonheme iron enzyme [Bacteroidales bacterium]|nr:SUMF1/EgtB/PvdO family nonheme iron enzyme [Bacteroidales bacterium]